jgi:hypothetical protein
MYLEIDAIAGLPLGDANVAITDLVTLTDDTREDRSADSAADLDGSVVGFDAKRRFVADLVRLGPFLGEGRTAQYHEAYDGEKKKAEDLYHRTPPHQLYVEEFCEVPRRRNLCNRGARGMTDSSGEEPCTCPNEHRSLLMEIDAGWRGGLAKWLTNLLR